MLLRHVIEHVKTQNWMAIAIDFVIVVSGVFIGIQVSNWNEDLALDRHEQMLISELRGEIAQNLADVRSRGDAFLVGAASARRVLDRIDRGGASCTDDCWSVVVDLMHASQWQQLLSDLPTYDELRRAGLPSDRRVIELVEKYKAYSHQSAVVLSVAPPYRALVRSLLPIDAQDAYWDHCYSLEDAIDDLLYPCPAPRDISIDPAKIDETLANPEILRSLREWTSVARVVGTTLTEPHQSLGEDILKRIDEGAEK